jgi:hypothetical protein
VIKLPAGTRFRSTMLFVLALALQACAKSGVASTVPAGKGVVSGGIQRCGALVEVPGYAKGSVIVVKGWPPSRGSREYAAWRAHIRPITRVSVRADQAYRFVLAPGRYTLMANSGERHEPFREVMVRRGAVLRADIIPGCI